MLIQLNKYVLMNVQPDSSKDQEEIWITSNVLKLLLLLKMLVVFGMLKLKELYVNVTTKIHLLNTLLKNKRLNLKVENVNLLEPIWETMKKFLARICLIKSKLPTVINVLKTKLNHHNKNVLNVIKLHG